MIAAFSLSKRASFFSCAICSEFHFYLIMQDSCRGLAIIRTVRWASFPPKCHDVLVITNRYVHVYILNVFRRNMRKWMDTSQISQKRVNCGLMHLRLMCTQHLSLKRYHSTSYRISHVHGVAWTLANRPCLKLAFNWRQRCLHIALSVTQGIFQSRQTSDFLHEVCIRYIFIADVFSLWVQKIQTKFSNTSKYQTFYC